MKTAEEFLKQKEIKDTLFSNGEWVKLGLSKLLDEYASQDKLVSVENAEEVWDKMSETIGTDIGSLDYYAGRDVMTKQSFMKLCNLLVPNPPKH